MLTLRDIEYILAIYETHSIVAAAKKCHVSQPALTMQLGKIEATLGFPIFERIRNNTTATSKGAKAIEHAKIIFEEYNKIKQISKSEQDVRVGIIPTIAPYLLPRIAPHLASFSLRMHFFEFKTEDALGELKRGNLDFIVLAHYPKIIEDSLDYIKLYREEFLFATHKDVDITPEEGSRSENIILLEEGNCMNESIKEICEEGFTENSFVASSIEVVKSLIANNSGYGILPEFSVVGNEGYKLQKFSQPRYREVGLVSKKGVSNSKIKESVRKLIMRQ